MCVLNVHTYIQAYRIDAGKTHQPTNLFNYTNGCTSIFHIQRLASHILNMYMFPIFLKKKKKERKEISQCHYNEQCFSD